MICPRLYAIVDHGAADRQGWTVVDLGQALIDGGTTLVQVRAPHATSRDLLDWCTALVRYGEPTGARVIVNDRADVAKLAGAAGVHLGQGDLEPAAARRILGEKAIIGLSTHTSAQVDSALRAPVDYVAVGPVYETGSKATGYEPVGLDLVTYAAAAIGPHRSVVAIGGITLHRAPEVIRAGARSVAVIADLLVGGDPRQRASDYVRVLEA